MFSPTQRRGSGLLISSSSSSSSSSSIARRGCGLAAHRPALPFSRAVANSNFRTIMNGRPQHQKQRRGRHLSSTAPTTTTTSPHQSLSSPMATAAAAAAAAPPMSRSIPALFVRGGTSNGLVIERRHLPPGDGGDQARAAPRSWRGVLAPAMGSPDPVHGRQLDGMGGGVSSTSKVCVVGPPSSSSSGGSSGSSAGAGAGSGAAAADVEFTFVQVRVRDGALDAAGNCGNMSSAVGPMAWDLGLVPDRERKVTRAAAKGGAEVEREGEEGSSSSSSSSYDDDYHEATVRVFNTNTRKTMLSRFRVTRATNREGGGEWRYDPRGGYEMDGVPGTQSPITLSFLDPAGAKTGRALPTGNAVDVLRFTTDGGAATLEEEIEASLVDVSNPGVFVRLADVVAGLPLPPPPSSSSSSSSSHRHPAGSHDAIAAAAAEAEHYTVPSAVEASRDLKCRLEAIRRAGAAAMGLDPDTESVPKVVALLPPPPPSLSSPDEDGVRPQQPPPDIRCLAMSMGQAHKAVPLTLALCLGAACNMEGTLAWQMKKQKKENASSSASSTSSSTVVIGHPSGTVEIGATTDADGRIVSAELLRTARLLMKGDVFY